MTELTDMYPHMLTLRDIKDYRGLFTDTYTYFKDALHHGRVYHYTNGTQHAYASTTVCTDLTIICFVCSNGGNTAEVLLEQLIAETKTDMALNLMGHNDDFLKEYYSRMGFRDTAHPMWDLTLTKGLIC